MQAKLPYVRDRLIERYFWILAIYFEPQHARTRIIRMKTCKWLGGFRWHIWYYGTYEELEIFTEAVKKYVDIVCMHCVLFLIYTSLSLFINLYMQPYSTHCMYILSRWSISCLDMLPECWKLEFLILIHKQRFYCEYPIAFSQVNHPSILNLLFLNK